MAALADAAGGPRRRIAATQIDATWRNCMLFDEHTWAQTAPPTQPESEFTKAQWRVKSQFAALRPTGADGVLHKGAAALASLVRTDGPALVVFNSTSWPRTDLVRGRLPAGMTVVEPGVASYTSRGDAFWLVRDVPPCGYRVLRPGPAATKPAAKPAEAGQQLLRRKPLLPGRVRSPLAAELRAPRQTTQPRVGRCQGAVPAESICLCGGRQRQHTDRAGASQPAAGPHDYGPRQGDAAAHPFRLAWRR